MSAEAHEDHGHTPAAWTAVTIIFIGSVVSAAAVIAAQPWLFWVGIGVIVLGAIVGKVMQMMGLGAKPDRAHPAAVSAAPSGPSGGAPNGGSAAAGS